MNGTSRKLAVVATVLVLHLVAVWALNAGLRARAVEVLVPVQLLARLVEQPRAVADTPAVAVVPVVPVPAAPLPPPAKPTPKPAKVLPRKADVEPVSKHARKPRPVSVPVSVSVPVPVPVPVSVSVPVPVPVPAPAAAAVPSRLPPAGETTPSPNAANTRSTPDTAPKGGPVAAPAAVAAPTMAPASISAPPAPPAPVAVELPSSDARYLQNPKPRYPPISHRLGEQGTVQIQVLVSDMGVAEEARIQSSSGFFRLDNAALATVLTWRFVPGKRAGVPESMWFTVPIRFGLQ